MINVLHIGPPLESVGGVAAVARAIQQMDFGPDVRLHYVPQTMAFRSQESLLKRIRRHLGHSYALNCRANKIQPQIIHVHTCSGFSFWRSVFDRFSIRFPHRALWVLHLHGGGFEEFYRRSNVLGRWIIRRTLQKADGVIVLSERWRAIMARIAPRAVIEVMPNGIQLPAAEAVEQAPRSTSLRISTLAKLDRAKGINDLLAAFAQTDVPMPTELLIAGPPGDLGTSESLTRQHPANADQRKVEFVGTLNDQQRDDLLAATDVFVLASHAEGLPLVLLESMARCKPVIATAVGGIPDLITHQFNGLLVPAHDPAALGEALRTLMIDRDMRNRLGRAARQTVANAFTLEHQRDRLSRLYRHLACKNVAPTARISTEYDSGCPSPPPFVSTGAVL